ncbi:DUF5999 family protein [Frankia sp. R82]|uniref:DUF5999 family protein n=1 Tax=Frankia sp. R82 TaxID=2950553 RepID=UPI002044ABA4|nr:DUF5999 family protein [Frankia sp. R82]MCM3882672.1 DUF5999 family protein [Frankia sp. R82]
MPGDDPEPSSIATGAMATSASAVAVSAGTTAASVRAGGPISHGASPPPCDCPHSPPCPAADSVDRDAARLASEHWDQGWCLLCNGVIRFDDTGEILPTGRTVEPRRTLPRPAGVPFAPAPRRANHTAIHA